MEIENKEIIQETITTNAEAFVNADNEIIPPSNAQQQSQQPAPQQPADVKRGRGRPRKDTQKQTQKQTRLDAIGETDKADFSDIPSQEPLKEPLKEQTNYRGLAEVIFHSATSTLCMTLGAEWAPKDATEANMVIEPLSKYLETQEVKDIPPGALLLLVIVAYSRERVMADNTKTKLIRTWLWLKSKLGKRK